MIGCARAVPTWVGLDGVQRTCPCALPRDHSTPCRCRHHVKDDAHRAKKAGEPDKRKWKEND